MSYSVVILSKTASKVARCVEAIGQHEPGADIIVVDDGVEWPEDNAEWGDLPTFCAVKGQKPFIFARNANIGIKAAGKRDVVLLNDDALLESPGGFSCMEQAAKDFPEYGIIASTCNNIGQRSQFPQGIGLRFEPRMVCFVCVYIPRSTIDLVGLLDEDFTAYSHQDDDYCVRVKLAGMSIGIHDGCFVEHTLLESDYRGTGGGDLRDGAAIFEAKWGTDNRGRPCKK